MSYQSDLESARQGNLSAISKLISQAFGNTTTVDAEKLLGSHLVLKIKSPKLLEPQDFLQKVIQTLNEIRPTKITSVTVSKIPFPNQKSKGWNKYLILKDENFVDHTKAHNRMSLIFVILIIYGFVWAFFIRKPEPVVINTQPEQPAIIVTQPKQPKQVLNNSNNRDAQSILNSITEIYGFSRFIDIWGMGTQGLFLPKAAWNNLSESDKQTLIKYARSRNLKAIIVGKQLSTNNISLDYTVWEK